MIDQSADVSAQAKTLISAPGDDAELLEQLKSLALAHETEFAACAGVWAPGLYERNPDLLRAVPGRLPGRQAGADH